MAISANDLAVIEQALRTAMNQGADYQSMLAYRGVLNKLQQLPTSTDEFTFQTKSEQLEQVKHDGFRYDVDDNAMN